MLLHRLVIMQDHHVTQHTPPKNLEMAIMLSGYSALHFKELRYKRASHTFSHLN